MICLCMQSTFLWMFYVLWSNHHQTHDDRKVYSKLFVCLLPPPLPPLMWVSQRMTRSSLNCLTFRKERFIVSSTPARDVIQSVAGTKRSMWYYWETSLSLLLHLSLSFLNHLKRRTKRNSGNWTLLTSFLIKSALSIGHTTVYKNLIAELSNTSVR